MKRESEREQTRGEKREWHEEKTKRQSSVGYSCRGERRRASESGEKEREEREREREKERRERRRGGRTVDERRTYLHWSL